MHSRCRFAAARVRRCDSRRTFKPTGRKEAEMLWTITILLFLLWLVGMVSNYTLGGFIHLLLLLAIVTMLIRIIQGRRPV